MPSIQFGLSSYERAEGNLPELPVINMMAEEAPTEDRGVMLQSRPGLDDRSADMGAGPVKQLFRRDLVLSSALFGVSDNKLYSGTTNLGAIDGTGAASIAGNEIGIMVTQGASLYFYNGTTLAAVTFPDSANVAHVSQGGSRFWLCRADTGKLYFTDALESDVEALDFLTAESFPDRLFMTLWIDGMLIAFGKESIEFFQQTGSATLPLKALQNMVIEEGVKGVNCAAPVGETFAAISSKNRVIYGFQAQVISNKGLHEKIEASSTHSCFTFLLGGDEYFAVRLDSETQCWNRRTGMWSEFQTLGLTNWAAQCYADGVFGSAEDGKTLQWGSDYTDALATSSVLERRFRGGFVLNGGGIDVNNVQLRGNVGNTSYLVTPYDDPTVEMRVSRDAARTWGNWKGRSWGKQGEYRQKVQWRGCGLASYPGFVAEFRMTDPVGFRISDVLLNESYGGR